MNDYIAGLNELFRYGDRENLLSLLASDPEHRQPNANARMIAADWFDDNAKGKDDNEFAHYLRSEHPLGVQRWSSGNPHVVRGSHRLHRLLTTLHNRYTRNSDDPDRGERRQADPLNAEAVKELRRLGRDHEAGMLETTHPVGYRDGVVAGDYPAYQWPGGNQLIYHTRDGGVLCPECRNGHNDSDAISPHATDDAQWDVIGADAYDEGPPINCDHCNRVLEATYGDPYAEDEDQ